MSLNAAAGISAVLGVPLTAVPVGLTIHGTMQSLRPKTKLKKWSIRIEQISSVIASKGDMLTPKEIDRFLRALRRYKEARDSFCQKIEDGDCTWYGKGMEHANDFSFCARIAWSTGLFLSTEASTRKLEEAQSYFPTTSTEADSNGATGISVNLEDDTEDDSGSDSESYCTAPEDSELIAVYNLWREMPKQSLAEEVEQNPCQRASRSIASPLDKRRGVAPSTSRQKPQYQT